MINTNETNDNVMQELLDVIEVTINDNSDDNLSKAKKDIEDEIEDELLGVIEVAINDNSNYNLSKAKKAIIKLMEMSHYESVPFADVFDLAAQKGNKEIVECIFSVMNVLKSDEDEVYDEDLNMVFENIPYNGCITALEYEHFEISDFLNDNWKDYQTEDLI
ncbi:MAG: hypothetical protein H8D35_00150, partial [Nitrosopumilus sp.]|nr:hypothetical protein [Nitrosopumilus sp.]